MKNLITLIVVSFLVLALGTGFFHAAYAQGGTSRLAAGNAQGTSTPDTVAVVRARVAEVEQQVIESIPGSDARSTDQTLKADILEGLDAGDTVEVHNDYTDLKAGDVFYLTITTSGADGSETYAAGEPYRLPTVLFFAALFVACVVLFGGVQGLRGLLSLIVSFLFIIFLLIPGIAHGFSPVLVSIGVASLIIILGSYVTHGFNRTTSSAVMGMIITVVVSGSLASAAMHYGHLTGMGSEDAVFLNLNAQTHIDLAGLLLGSILIGLLGVLYDISIGQAIAVEELHHVGPHISRWVIYKRANRIGREHIGALVNTLAIAYVGVSLPLLLLFYSSSAAPLPVTLNMEIFATEIIRIMIGSIGLVIAVPVTTLISVLFLIRNGSADEATGKNMEAKDMEAERRAIEAPGMGHHHH